MVRTSAITRHALKSALTLFLGLGLLVTPLWAKERSYLETKSEALRALQEMRTQNVKRLKEIDDTLRVYIEDSPAATVEFEVDRLGVAKREHALRQEFLNRLIFQVDTKFIGGDLRQFLTRALTDMAKTDATTNASTKADSGLWKFMKFAAEAIQHIPEKKENILTFLEGYMNRSVSQPIRPEDYISTRNYSNGLTSESGRPLARDQVGEVAENRLRDLPEKQMEPAKAPPAPAAPIQPPPSNPEF